MQYTDIVLRHQYIQFIKIGDMEDFSIFGAGSEELNTDYEAEEFEFKAVTSKTAQSFPTGYTRNTSVEQVVFKDDPLFTAIDKLRRKLALGTQASGELISVYLYDETTDAPTTAPADQDNVTIIFTGFGGPSSAPISISYELKYTSTPVAGTATIDYTTQTATFAPAVV